MPFTPQPIAITAATTLSKKTHGGGLVVFNSTTGVTLTLPASSGDGTRFEIVFNKTISSGSFVCQVANATDVIQGTAFTIDDDGVPANAWATSATSDTITMDGSTQGGKIGDRITLTDMASGFYQVNILSNESGTEATPFSAAVS